MTAGSMLAGTLAAAWGAPLAVVLMGGTLAAGAILIYAAVPHVRSIR